MKLSLLISLLLSCGFAYYSFREIDGTYRQLNEKGIVARLDTVGRASKDVRFFFTSNKGEKIFLPHKEGNYYIRKNRFSDNYIIYNPGNPKVNWIKEDYDTYDSDQTFKDQMFLTNLFVFGFLNVVFYFLRKLYKDFTESLRKQRQV